MKNAGRGSDTPKTYQAGPSDNLGGMGDNGSPPFFTANTNLPTDFLKMSKRLNSRLNAIETTNADCELSNGDKRMLVGILAKRDSLFWPWRFQQRISGRLPEIVRRARECLTGVSGIAVKAEGSSWKTISERRQKLIAAGLLTAAVSGGQITSVFLTHRGESISRQLVGVRLASFWGEGVSVAARLYRLAGERLRVPIRESILWQRPCNGSPENWDALTETVLPCLTCGLIRCHSDSEGRACYSTVDAVPLPEKIVVDVQAEDWADDEYLRAFDRERRTLEAVEPRDSSELYIPFPATGWGKHYDERADTDGEQ